MFVVQIFTNGSLVNETLLDELDKRKISPTFMISFDGVGYHDIMRGVKGAEERFYRCVDLLISRGFRVTCNMCFTKDSIVSIWETIETLAAKGVESLTVYPPVESGLWKDRYIEMGGGGCRMSAFEKTGDLLGYDPQMCYFFEHGFPEKFREAIQRGEKKRTGNVSLLDMLTSLR